MPAKIHKAPPHLAAETAAWWLHVHAEFSLEQHHVRLLTLAAEAWDRCGQARALIDADGPVTVTPDGGLMAHPAVAIERDARLAFARVLRELDLDATAPPERARPPGLHSNRRGT